MSTTHPQNVRLIAELDRRILHGLRCQWERELWVLEPEPQRRMRPPAFALADLGQILARWSAERREISFSRSFVRHHAWTDVRDVLRHEMAHQFADEVLEGSDETPHGPVFREACRLLRACPEASGRYPPLSRRLAQGDTGPRDRILDRVTKLLALAESSHRHEAEAAMAKAHEYIARYNVDLLEGRAIRHYRTINLGPPRLRQPREAYHLANLLADFYFVHVIWVPCFVVEKDKTGSVLEISGTPENLGLAAYVFDFVNGYIDREWEAYRDGKRLGRRARTDFAVGIIEGFRGSMRDADRRRADRDGTRALVRVRDPQLRAYCRHLYPHVRHTYGRARREDAHARRAGEKAGERMIVSKPIERTGTGIRGHLRG